MARQNTTFKNAYNRTLALLSAGGLETSEPALGRTLGVSRTTVRAVLSRLAERGIVVSEGRRRSILRAPADDDYFAEAETDPLSNVIERTFMKRILEADAKAGTHVNELELAREIGVATSSVREFLIRFSRFGLIEKRPNSHWVLKGFNRAFADELAEVREMFEMRSALAFAALPKDNPLWGRLDLLEAEHRGLLDTIGQHFAGFSELDERFHRLIHAASRNRFIIDFYDVIAMVFHYHYQWNKQNERERNEQAIHEHLAYIAALRSGDVRRVRDACATHLESARATLLASTV
ncbi:GntR family transcriptional regulator [Chthonobacter albigriseus]|uniref:GntR family transcriptional regulator n=1 Tax=Chthonobacter albigriseus TaxID=1683161 RepID=UPI0015EFD42E|nr:GntR family transcriptional regulator [Chthonobacter albigriseus]